MSAPRCSGFRRVASCFRLKSSPAPSVPARSCDRVAAPIPGAPVARHTARPAALPRCQTRRHDKPLQSHCAHRSAGRRRWRGTCTDRAQLGAAPWPARAVGRRSRGRSNPGRRIAGQPCPRSAPSSRPPRHPGPPQPTLPRSAALHRPASASPGRRCGRTATTAVPPWVAMPDAARPIYSRAR